jgi:hypothetical protein
MMQCVTYNKFSLFAQKEEKTTFSNVFEVRKNDLFLYQMEMLKDKDYKRHCSILIKINFNHQNIF